jgi:GTPase
MQVPISLALNSLMESDLIPHPGAGDCAKQGALCEQGTGTCFACAKLSEIPRLRSRCSLLGMTYGDIPDQFGDLPLTTMETEPQPRIGLADPANMTEAGQYRAGFVAIGGRTNVGKSTLINQIVGQKVAIVTPKPQTTRRRIIGVRTDSDAQLILIDTPGLHEPRRPLNRRMVDTARRCLSEAEVIVAVIEAGNGLNHGDRRFLAQVPRFGRPVVVAINKIDLVRRDSLLPLVGEAHQAIAGSEIVPVSARSGENIDELVRVVKPLLPQGGPLMPAEEYTDQSERLLSEEIIREKLFIGMRQEIPFSTAVMVEQFTDEPVRRLTRISAVIIIERDTHKGMVIGAGGSMLKEIGTQARLELEEILGRRIFLELHVKVEKGWTSDPRKLKELGL